MSTYRLRNYKITNNYRHNYYRTILKVKPRSLAPGIILRTGFSLGSSIRRNSFSIFALFVILLFYFSFVSYAVNNSTVPFNFESFLRYLSNWSIFTETNFHSLFSLTSADIMRISRAMSELRFTGIFADLQVLYTLFVTPARMFLNFLGILFFCAECLYYLISFVLGIFAYIGLLF